MGDESDWESVNDFNNDDGTEVVVEMPPGGILSESAERMIPSEICASAASASSFSLVKKIGTVNIKDDKSTTRSETSSYVIKDSESLSSVTSSYVAVPRSRSANASVSEQSLGSLISDFEVISLSSGEVMLHCNRCRARYPIGTTICETCYEAIVANPCQDVDAQLALALQQQEFERQSEKLIESERKRRHLKDQSPFDQAKFLSGEILNFLKIAHSDFRGFPDIDLNLLCSSFITAAQDGVLLPIISIALTSTYCHEYSSIRTEGFSNQVDVKVYRPTDTAIEELKSAATDMQGELGPEKKCRLQKVEKLCENSWTLGTIHEHNENHRDLSQNVWVVAVVESLDDLSESPFPRWIRKGCHILPMACYDPVTMTEIESIKAVVNGLSQVCHDFFFDGLDLGNYEGHIKKKAKASNMAVSFDVDPLEKLNGDRFASFFDSSQVADDIEEELHFLKSQQQAMKVDIERTSTIQKKCGNSDCEKVHGEKDSKGKMIRLSIRCKACLEVYYCSTRCRYTAKESHIPECISIQKERNKRQEENEANQKAGRSSNDSQNTGPDSPPNAPVRSKSELPQLPKGKNQAKEAEQTWMATEAEYLALATFEPTVGKPCGNPNCGKIHGTGMQNGAIGSVRLFVRCKHCRVEYYCSNICIYIARQYHQATCILNQAALQNMIDKTQQLKSALDNVQPLVDLRDKQQQEEEKAKEVSSTSHVGDLDLSKPAITSLDVIFGKGTAKGHPGTVRLRELVEKRRSRYDVAEQWEKTMIADEIVEKITSSGGRFFQSSENGQQLVGWEIAHHEICNLFQNLRLAQLGLYTKRA